MLREIKYIFTEIKYMASNADWFFIFLLSLALNVIAVIVLLNL
jgi:hypothetical protein